MTEASCRRLWQVEAARDGRLSGTDLSNALRHRAECADCGQAARALDELGRRIKALPILETDSLAHRRTRQALLGAWNEHLMAEPAPKSSLRMVLIVAGCAIGGVALALGYALPYRRGPSRTALEPQQHAPVVAPNAESSPSSLPLLDTPAAPQRATSPLAIHSVQSGVSAAKSQAKTKKTPTASPGMVGAEDDAYLEIVGLLRSGREREARAKAAQYLVRFPAGFRRLEVAKIAR